MAQFDPSRSGVGQMATSQDMETEMRRRAQRTKEVAEQAAPEHLGEYKASFDVSSTRYGGPQHDRAAGIVTNTSSHARWVEYGRRPGPDGKGGHEGSHTLFNAAVAANTDTG